METEEKKRHTVDLSDVGVLRGWGRDCASRFLQ
jgi:hypothetical protein